MKMYLDMAGSRMELSSTNSSLFPLVKKRYSRYVTGEGPVSARISVSLEKELTVLEDGPVGEEFRLEVTPKGTTISIRSYHFMGGFDFRRNTGWLTAETRDILGSLDNYLRVVGAGLLGKDDGLLLHAAGVSRDGHGYLFPGPSGAGKSTIASLSEKGQVLGDDIVAVRKKHGYFSLHSVPMHGEKSFSPGSVKLRGIYFPIQDRQIFLEHLSHAHAMALILSALPFLSPKERTNPLLLSQCERLVEEVPARKLHFTKNDAFWTLIHTD